VIDRLSTFSDPEIIKLINEHFIPVAENDWYQRRRQDAVGEFFRKVADQGPRKGQGGSTRQGHYALTAGGTLLEYNNNRGSEKHSGMIKSALKKWNALPEAQRKPGAVKVDALGTDQLDKKYARLMPEGTVVLKTSTRLLKRTAIGYAPIAKEENTHNWGHLAAHNQVWLQAKEIAGLRALNSTEPVDLPKPIAFRLMRFHLIDNTRGEPPFWNRDDISDYQMTLRTPVGKPNRRVLEGHALLKHGSDRGFDVKVLGYFDLHPERDKLIEVKVAALGSHWGSGKFTSGARPGPTPLGIAFSLADMEKDPAAKVPPQGSHWLDGYLEADRR
jgi:hypothetical protein